MIFTKVSYSNSDNGDKQEFNNIDHREVADAAILILYAEQCRHEDSQSILTEVSRQLPCLLIVSFKATDFEDGSKEKENVIYYF